MLFTAKRISRTKKAGAWVSVKFLILGKKIQKLLELIILDTIQMTLVIAISNIVLATTLQLHFLFLDDI